MSMNFKNRRFEKKALPVSLLVGIIIFILLFSFSNLEFVKDSARTFEGDDLFWTIVASVGLAAACYWVLVCIEDYMAHCSNKTEAKQFVRKTFLRYILPIGLACLAALIVAALFEINIFGEVIIFATILFVMTFPKFLQKHLPKE